MILVGDVNYNESIQNMLQLILAIQLPLLLLLRLGIPAINAHTRTDKGVSCGNLLSLLKFLAGLCWIVASC